MQPPSGRTRAEVLRERIESLRLELHRGWSLPYRRVQALYESLAEAQRELRSLERMARFPHGHSDGA